jgi:hypothetical protein
MYEGNADFPVITMELVYLSKQQVVSLVSMLAVQVLNIPALPQSLRDHEYPIVMYRNFRSIRVGSHEEARVKSLRRHKTRVTMLQFSHPQYLCYPCSLLQEDTPSTLKIRGP